MYKILKDFKGSPDGCRVIDFTEGQEIPESTDFPMSLIEVALAEGWAEVKAAPKKKAAKKKAAKK